MEKKLLALLALTICAPSISAKMVTVKKQAKTTPAQKLQPTRYEKAMDAIEELYDSAIQQISERLTQLEAKGQQLPQEDYHNLVLNLKALTYPRPKMTGAQLKGTDAQYLYKIAYDTFNKIKHTADLMPGQGFGVGVSFIHDAIGRIAASHISTMPSIPLRPAKGSRTAASK